MVSALAIGWYIIMNTLNAMKLVRLNSGLYIVLTRSLTFGGMSTYLVCSLTQAVKN